MRDLIDVPTWYTPSQRRLKPTFSMLKVVQLISYHVIIMYVKKIFYTINLISNCI